MNRVLPGLLLLLFLLNGILLPAWHLVYAHADRVETPTTCCGGGHTAAEDSRAPRLMPAIPFCAICHLAKAPLADDASDTPHPAIAGYSPPLLSFGAAPFAGAPIFRNALPRGPPRSV